MTTTRPARHSAGRHLRPDPSNVLLVILSLTFLLMSALALGGLAARPFAG